MAKFADINYFLLFTDLVPPDFRKIPEGLVFLYLLWRLLILVDRAVLNAENTRIVIIKIYLSEMQDREAKSCHFPMNGCEFYL